MNILLGINAGFTSFFFLAFFRLLVKKKTIMCDDYNSYVSAVENTMELGFLINK